MIDAIERYYLKGKDLVADLKQMLPFIPAEKKEEIAAKQKVNARTILRCELLPDGNELATYGDGRTRIHHYDGGRLPQSKFGSPNVVDWQGKPASQSSFQDGVNELEGVTFLDGPFTGNRGVKLTSKEMAEIRTRQRVPGEPQGEVSELEGVSFRDTPFGFHRGVKISEQEARDFAAKQRRAQGEIFE